jgi:excisionase family DNA binding protein
MQNESGQSLVYTVEQAGKLLGLSRPTSYKYANDGTLPVVRLGRRLVVPKTRLERLLNGDQPKS